MSKLLKLILSAAAIGTLTGCIAIHESHPAVQVYRAHQPFRHHEVIPIRTENFIGYQDRHGTLHLWPAR
jgi:hypothetical protein